MITFYITLFFLIQNMPLSSGEDRRDNERQNKQRQDERSTTRPQQFRYARTKFCDSGPIQNPDHSPDTRPK
jgi:hypothetical protein